MPRRLSFAFVGIALAILPLVLRTSVGADDGVPSRPVNADKYAKGVLWKIERAGEKSSYLFGTIHLSDKRLTKLPAAVDKAFEDAASLTTELVVDPQAVAKLMQAMFFRDGGTLESAVGAATYRDVQRAFTERGMPNADVNRFKPWAVFLMLSMPVPADSPPLDMQLQMRAGAAGKKIEGLETIQEQIDVFSEMSADEQRTMLEATLRELHASAKQIEAMIQAYLARDLAHLQKMADEHAPAEATLHAKFTQRLLTDRNRRMAERLRPLLKQGNTFIAVGAAHLPGRDGLLALLEHEGYRVRPIY